MLTAEQVEEIKEHLNRAQNPVFFYDNDADGLCSFLILRRYLGRGKGVAVRSYPDLNASYAKRAQELNADYVFVLDKPVVSKEFIEELDKIGLPIVWIDHHDMPEIEGKFENLHIYNPAKNKGKNKSDEPVTYLSYKITNRKEDLWIAVIGCISDHFMPEFIEEFKKRYPEFWGKVKEPNEAYYETEIGRITKSLNFGLKDSITNVVQLQNFLIKCAGPDDVFSEINDNSAFRKKYGEIRQKYNSLLNEASTFKYGKLIFFKYGGDLSISSELSNELYHNNPKKYVMVVYTKGSISNISLRGKKIRDILIKVLKNFEGATGGGHEDAVGARMKTEDVDKFKKALEEEIK